MAEVVPDRVPQATTDGRAVSDRGGTARRDTTSLGDLSEYEITLALMRAGKRILRPLSSGLRYDLAIDNGDSTVIRVQCKTGRLRGSCISFRTSSADARRPNGVPYVGQVEAFGVFCPENGRSYLIPVSALDRAARFGTLRLEATRNGQTRNVRYAREFLIS